MLKAGTLTMHMESQNIDVCIVAIYNLQNLISMNGSQFLPEDGSIQALKDTSEGIIKGQSLTKELKEDKAEIKR